MSENIMSCDIEKKPGFATVRAVFVLCSLLWFLISASGVSVASEVTYTQTFELHPGWNAIYLEVQPEQNDIDQMLAGIPVESAWRWFPREIEQLEFVQDPAEGLQNINGWHGYFPYPHPESFLTNLFTMTANQTYLIKLTGTQNLTWQVTGKPKLKRQKWISNSYNLVGLRVEPGNEPTFGDYFSPSPAHAGQSIYRLDAAGVWQSVAQPFSTPAKTGEAYWVFTKGTSNYQGPMDVSLEYDVDLDYKSSLNTQKIIVQNNADIPTAITLRRLITTQNRLPLSFELKDDAAGERSWPDLQETLSYFVSSRDDVFINLAVRRADLLEERMEEMLEFTNGLGSRVLVHVGANTTQVPVLPANFSSDSQLSGQNSGTISADVSAVRSVGSALNPLSGLWVGTVLIEGVSNAQFGDVDPQPTGQGFPMRFIIHVDTTGQARLLKDVIEMWQDGTYKPSATDPSLLETDVPGRYALITDPNLIPGYSGAKLRDGTPVGIRHSSIAYDFEGQYLDFQPETFAPPFTMATTVRLASDYLTNPFLHKYHPDHDNLDAQFLNPKEEAYEVTRAMEFEFTAEVPSGDTPHGWGDAILGGIYRETVSGLHRNAIFTEGEFRFRRISTVPVLNQ